MRVLLTGSTGMVGAHTAAALHRAGHELRLLVRDPGRIARALDPLGVPAPEHVTGDVTDAAAVERGLDGCDAGRKCEQRHALLGNVAGPNQH